MLTIRLARVGTKNNPVYRLVISERGRDLYGKALEILGSYNPHTKKLQAKADRINYWIKMGSQMSPTVNNLLVDNKIIEGEKKKASKPGKKPIEAEAVTEKPAEEPKTE